MLTSL